MTTFTSANTFGGARLIVSVLTVTGELNLPDGVSIDLPAAIEVDSITAETVNGDLTLSGNGTGDVVIGGTDLLTDTINESTTSAGITTTSDFNITGAHLSQTHISDENGDSCYTLDCDAAGFSDIKALNIVYTTGANAPGSNEEMILVNIDREASQASSSCVGLEVTATSGLCSVSAIHVGTDVAVIEQESGTFVDPDVGEVNAVDDLADLINPATNVAVFTADNDTMTIGDIAKFDEIELLFTTASSGAGIQPLFEFSTGVGTWTTFGPTDSTNGCRNSGTVHWVVANIPTWAVGTGSNFLIRITRQRNTLGTTPVNNSMQIAATASYSWDKNGDMTIKDISSTGILTIDTINEQTSAAGVTLDGTLVKDSSNVSIDSNVVKTNTIQEFTSANGIDYLSASGGSHDFQINSATAMVVTSGGISTNIVNEVTGAAGVTIDGTLIKDSSSVSIDTNVVKTNTINEFTGAAGVTIDSVLIRDNGVTAGNINISGNTLSSTSGDLIIDSATADLLLGDIVISRTVATSLVSIKGGLAATSNTELSMFGESHGSFADLTVLKGAIVNLNDENDATRLSISSAGVVLGAVTLSRDVANSLVAFTGGSQSSGISQLVMWGESHATLANRTHLRGNPVSIRDTADVEKGRFETSTATPTLLIDQINELTSAAGVTIDSVLIKDNGVTATNLTGTLQTVAQTNITTVGTLTVLDVDNININGNTIISTDTNGDIALDPNGSGNVNIVSGELEFAGASTLTATGLGSAVVNSSLTTVGTLTVLDVDNININGNTIISTDTNGDIALDPNGSGNVNIVSGELEFAGASTLTATGLGSAVVNSSLTTVGTLSALGTSVTTNTIFERTTAITNSPLAPLLLKAKTSGNMVDDFGVSLQFIMEDDTSGEVITGLFQNQRNGADATTLMNIIVKNAAANVIYCFDHTQLLMPTGTKITGASGDKLQFDTGGGAWNVLNVPNGTGTQLSRTAGDDIVEETSSRRFKKNIKYLENFSSPILDVRPVVYCRKNDPEEKLEIGLIAEDLDKIGLKNFVVYKHGEPYSISYSRLIVPLISEVKKLRTEINLIMTHLGLELIH